MNTSPAYVIHLTLARLYVSYMAIKNREFKINCQNKKLIYKDKKKVNGDKRIKSAGNSTLDNVAKGHCRSPETAEE